MLHPWTPPQVLLLREPVGRAYSSYYNGEDIVGSYAMSVGARHAFRALDRGDVPDRLQGQRSSSSRASRSPIALDEQGTIGADGWQPAEIGQRSPQKFHELAEIDIAIANQCAHPDGDPAKDNTAVFRHSPTSKAWGVGACAGRPGSSKAQGRPMYATRTRELRVGKPCPALCPGRVGGAACLHHRHCCDAVARAHGHAYWPGCGCDHVDKGLDKAHLWTSVDTYASWLKALLPHLTTAPHAPAWRLLGLRPLLRTPQSAA